MLIIFEFFNWILQKKNNNNFIALHRLQKICKCVHPIYHEYKFSIKYIEL